jgi:hypothetical protein
MHRLYLTVFSVLAAALPSFASVDAALLALVPPGSKVVAGIDFEKARASQFGQFVTAKMNTTDQGLARFVAETGFDPRHDLQQVLIAATEPTGNGNPSKVAVLARGTFDQDRIRAAAKAKGIASRPFQGVDLFVDKSDHNGPNAFAFLDEGTGVMGDTESVQQVIANRGAATVLDPALQAAITRTASENDVWFVSSLSGDFLAHHVNAQVNGDQPNSEAKPAFAQAQALQSVVQSSGGIQFGSSVRVSFDAITRSPQDATSLADVVRFFASMVQMSRQKDPRAGIAASAFDNMDLKTDGDALHVSIWVPEKSLEQLIEEIPKPGSADPHPAAQHSHAQ